MIATLEFLGYIGLIFLGVLVLISLIEFIWKMM